MPQTYRVTRCVTEKECHWLQHTVHEGTRVQDFQGHTYGCIGDGVAVTVDGESFFELPWDALEPVAEDVTL